MTNPWHYQQVGTPGYFVVRDLSGHILPRTEDEARMMAAVPDLMAACMDLCARFDPGDTYYSRSAELARAALRKAAGREYS